MSAPVPEAAVCTRVARAPGGWLPVVVLPIVALVVLPRGWPSMWGVALAIYAGCKWLTWRRTFVPRAPAWRQVAYLLAWPGMDAAAFLNPAMIACRPSGVEWIFAVGKLLLGVLTLHGGVRLLPTRWPELVGWAGMVGLVLSLHFGLFHLLSCFWRSRGVQARPLMNGPAMAVSLAEFWGRRWNTAFRDLTHRFLFRPLLARCGARAAALGGFVTSGLVHDLVITVPAGGGYGGPTLYFILQGLGMLTERSQAGRRLGLGAGGRGWTFTMVTLLAPVGLLFPRPFILGVIVPFLHAIGAVP